MITLLLALALLFAVLAYVPLVVLVTHRDRVRTFRRRPVDEVLADAYAQGMITRERFDELMDEVHAALPTPDAPYPLVRDLEPRR